MVALQYDAAAAGALSRALAQLVEKLDALATQRATLDKRYLAGTWTGKHRDDFALAWTRQQRTLADLAQSARTAKSKVDKATADAAAAARVTVPPNVR